MKVKYLSYNTSIIECSNGSRMWYKDGLQHRIDGPAIENSDGKKSLWILNQYLEEEEFNSWTERLKKFIIGI